MWLDWITEAYFRDYEHGNGLLLGRHTFAILHVQLIDDIMKKYSLVFATRAKNKLKSQIGSTK